MTSKNELSEMGIIEEIWSGVSSNAAAVAGVHIDVDKYGRVPPQCCFRVVEASTAAIACSALAAAEIDSLRRQNTSTDAENDDYKVHINPWHAYAEFKSETLLNLKTSRTPPIWNPLSGNYRTADGHIRLHCNFPHHAEGVVKFLGCEATREAVAKEVLRWNGRDLETELVKIGMVAGCVRSRQEWLVHPQRQLLAEKKLISVEKIMPTEPLELPRLESLAEDMPLKGINVLDLTRVLAGPVCCRTLAYHGANVMRVSCQRLPSVTIGVIDTGAGKLNTSLDLSTPHGKEKLKQLVKGADIFVQAYRPGAMDDLGFSAKEVAAMAAPRGIVYVSISAYGDEGTWGSRRGFDSVVQCVSGMAHECGCRCSGLESKGQATAASPDTAPKQLPCQVLDHGTGHLAACGALTALKNRIQDGGSYHVKVSLARTQIWLDSLGRNLCKSPPLDFKHFMQHDEGAEAATGFGELGRVSPCPRMKAYTTRYCRPASKLGALSEPSWASFT